ncbi:type I polyketide synthase [Streptomyces spinoverrucosus]|uniref:type I polyketide synthase n=1 Tax=Streptomyces spinoverrucosus TaxID=284043 RepID=UPI0027DA8652|nr:type I polyketide synthase [Streptomyces spinoverrucosus]
MVSQNPDTEHEATANEPIAVIGMGCRFAGDIDSPERFWNFLMAGRDAISEIPSERWEPYASSSAENAALLRRTTRFGGFLTDIQGFDAEFFGITPREAELMDPQQRIVLEVAWEALEHAGVPPRSLAGGDTGVFIGVGSDDYGRRLLEDLPRIEAWTGIGGAFCAVANRISYTLDLRGSSVAVDTACSSSLVAIHQACQTLRLGEVPLALAGGVMIMAGPGLTMVLDAAGATSPDGRSKSFDAAANGYGRGEGAGVIVLKRLSDARRDGDRVLAVIRGSGIHQDGKTKGIMAPSQEAQTHLLRRTYEHAQISPASVDYVEAHGTGTRMGDPIEAGAMAAVFGVDRPANRPCLIGSVKPSIGHLEAGAGVAGVIKAVLALRHAQIPPTANFERPNPAIPWAESGLEVVAEPTPWPRTDGPRRAGVSGYGYGGTISHVILEQAPETPEPAKDDPDRKPVARVYPLSGASEAAVREYAGRLADVLETEPTAPSAAALGHTLALRRSHLAHRATVVAGDRAELVSRLRALAAEASVPGVARGRSASGAAAGAGLVWVFSGHGAQWLGMGRELLATHPEFAAVIDEITPVFMAEIGFCPRQVISDGELGDVSRIQPMIFAMQVGLAAVWRALGVVPDAVIGHSVGEIAAAVTAGVLSLQDGARLICRRSILLRRVAGLGGMAMVNLPFEEAARRLAERTDVVAAISASPSSTVVAGDAAAVESVSARWKDDGLVVRRVDSDVAFHSSHMDPLLDELAAADHDLDIRPATLHVYTTALDDPRANPLRYGGYWAANLRNPVRFAEAVTAAVEDGYRRFVEVSAHPVVAHSIDETLDSLGVTDALVAHTLRRGKPERETLLTNLGALHCHGGEIDWAAMWPASVLAELPPPVWQHRPYWAESGPRTAGGGGHDVDSHTLLGTRAVVTATTPLQVWQTYLDETCRPYPGDHPVQGVEIIPATVLLNTFFTAATGTGERPALSDVSLRVPVSVTAARELQVTLQDGTVRLASRLLGQGADDGDGPAWLTHTTASVSHGVTVADDRVLPLTDILSRCTESLSPDFPVDRLASIGVAAMGFPWAVEELLSGPGELLARVRADGESEELPTSWASVLDAALSVASVAFDGPPTLRMPAHIREIALRGDSPARVLISVRVAEGTAAADTVHVEIADETGRVVATLRALRYGVLDGDPGAAASPRRLVHEMVWRPLELDASSTERPGLVVLVGDDSALKAALAERLTTAGTPCVSLTTPRELDTVRERLGASTAVLVVPAVTATSETVTDAAFRATWLLAGAAQWLAAARLADRPKLWCLTQGVHESADATGLGHGGLWGLGRVIGGEHPDLWGGLVDLAADGAAPRADEMLSVLGSVRGEDVIVVRDGRWTISRLARLEKDATRAATEFRADGTYLITGGLGALGLEIAHWMAGRGARRLVLAGRSGLPPRETWDSVEDPRVQRQIEAVRSLEALGVTVRALALDITDRDQAAKLLSPSELQLPPVKGVVHAAGVLDNRMLADLTEDSLRTVMRPKVDGALVLHEIFPPGSVDFFALFSSCGLLLGLPGQASYASANAFLDALAGHRRAAGDHATVSFGWTSWRGLGMSTSSEVIDAELEARGTADITVAEAFRCWELADRHDSGYYAVLRMLPPTPGAVRPRLLSEMTVDDGEGTASGDAGDAEWQSLSPDELHGYLVDAVRQSVADVMKTSPADLDVRAPLTELGLDSVMTVVVRRRLEKRFRLALPATLLWERPSVEAVAGFLRGELSPGDADTDPPSDIAPAGERTDAELLVG